MTLLKNQRKPNKPNGHAGEDDRPGGTGGRQRVNGHSLASTERGGIPVQRDQAASDDTRRVSAAMDASSTIAPGTDCAGYAEVAPPHPNGEVHEVGGNTPEPETKAKSKKEKIPGGEFPLPDNPGDFVEEIHRRVDLFQIWQK